MRIPDTELDVRDLRLVLALASAGTTRGAGEILHLAQPSVSRALISLEQRVDNSLFRRTPQGLVPTEAGARFCALARPLLGELVALEASVSAPDQTVKRVRLVCECYTAYHWLPSVLIELRQELPELNLALRIEHTREPLQALRDRRVDAALVTTPVKSDKQTLVAPLFADEVIFLLAEDHPLARKKTLSPADIEKSHLITARSPEAEVRWFMSSVFGRARPQLDVTLIPLTEAIVDLTRAGLGIGIVSEWMATRYLEGDGLVTRRLKSGPLNRPWSLAWQRELGAVGPQLLQALRDCQP